MKMPPGYGQILETLKEDQVFSEILNDLDDETVGALQQCIYGLVQASRMWYKTMANILEKCRVSLFDSVCST